MIYAHIIILKTAEELDTQKIWITKLHILYP